MSRPLPAIGSARRLAPLRAQAGALANGLRVVTVERRGLPIVDIEIVITSGAAIDAPAQSGRMSMVAELLDEGTRTRDALQIAEQLDYLGGHFEVQASWDAISISLQIIRDRLEPALDIVCDVVLNAVFPGQELARKAAERIGFLKQEQDEAALLAGKALAAAVFAGGHPYMRPLAGTIASIGALTRDDIASVYHRHFTPGNAFVVAVGDVGTDAIVAMLEQRLATWKGDAQPPLATLVAPASTQRHVLLVEKPGAAQAELRVGHAGPARATADYFPLVVMNTMLGGAFTSRLNTVLRERMGVTYGASSRFIFRRQGGIFTVGSAVFTEAAARSAQVVVAELERMASELVPAAELRRAQNYIALGLPRDFESTDDIAAHLREQILHDLPVDYWESYVDRVFAVSAADVAAVAARHLQPGRCTIVVVADGSVAGALEEAGLGALQRTNVEA